MSKFLEGQDRSQGSLFPGRLDECARKRIRSGCKALSAATGHLSLQGDRTDEPWRLDCQDGAVELHQNVFGSAAHE